MLRIDDDYRDQYRKFMMKSKEYKNALDKDQRDRLVDFMFRETENWRTSPTGNLFFRGNFKRLGEEFIVPWLGDLISDTIDFDSVTSWQGNFFHTPHQYGIHTDMPEPNNEFSENKITYRSILIPLYILPDRTTHMTFFDQRVIDTGCTLDWGPYKSTTHYRSFTDYSLIEHVYTLDGLTTIGDEDMTQEEFEKNHFHEAPSSIERYKGLSVENTFEWTPGTVMTFDTAQIHCSSLGNPPFKTKAGLRISLFRDRD